MHVLCERIWSELPTLNESTRRPIQLSEHVTKLCDVGANDLKKYKNLNELKCLIEDRQPYNEYKCSDLQLVDCILTISMG